MVVIKEDYVSFETAKLLKDKGFNGVCRYYYPDSHTQLISYVDCKQTDMFGPEACIAPTLQMAMKWLRKEHNFFIEIHYGNVGSPEEPETQWWWELENKNGVFLECNITNGNNTYEEACEEAIKYCLRNLI